MPGGMRGMSGYELLPGSRTGLRIADEATGNTVVLTGRILDNLSEASAREIAGLLERRDRLRRQHLQSAADRNDLTRLFEDMHAGGA